MGRPRPPTFWPPPCVRRWNFSGAGLVHNADGANLHHGLASALSQHPEADIAILECDERVVSDVIRLGRPEVLVLLNFSRDQLDRHHEIKGLGRSWRTALTDAGPNGPIVVANADEPLVVWAALAAKQVVWVDTASSWRQDSSLCPECDASLIRTQPDPASGLGGDWYCSGCELARPKGDYRVESGTIIDRTQQVWDPQLSVPGVFNVSNAACALAAAELMGVEPRAALSGMRTVTSPAGRFATATIREDDGSPAAGQESGWLGRSAAACANPDRDTRDRLRGGRRAGCVVALGCRLRAAGGAVGDRYRSARPGPRRTPQVRGR